MLNVKDTFPSQGENCQSMAEDGEARMCGTTYKEGNSHIR